MIASATTSPNTGPDMRRLARFVLLCLLLAGAGCGKKPAPPAPPPDDPNPAPGPNPGAPDTGAERKKMLAGLKHSNQDTRRAAIEDLSWLAEEDTAVVPALIELLRDKGTGATGHTSPNRVNSTREAAALALLKCTNGEKLMREKGLPVLREELSNPSPVIREYTAYLVGQLGAMSKPLAADVQKLCTDKDANVRGVAFDALRTTGIADPVALAKLLRHEDEEVVRLAAELIPLVESMPEGGVAALIDALKSANTNVQYAASTGLATAGPKAASAAPALVEAINKYYPDKYDPKAPRAESVESAYWAALEKIGAPAVAPVVKLLGHTNEMVQWKALETLAAIGPPAKDAADALKKMMAKRDGASLYAAHALVRIGESKDEAIALLKEALQLRTAAATATQIVTRLGKAGQPLHAAALANLTSGDIATRYYVLSLIATLPPEEAQKVAAETGKLATDESDDVRKNLGTVLAKLGPAAAPAADALGKALATEQATIIRDQFGEARVAMGAGASPALPGLLPLVTNKELSSPLRAKVIAAVAVADPASAEVAAALVKVADDPDQAIRASAAGALGHLNPLPADALNTLLKLARGDRMNGPRVAALRALTTAGPRAKPAKADLDAMAAGPQAHLALWAKVAVAAVDGDVHKAAPVIRAGLGDRNQLVRSSAAEALLVFGPTAADLPALLKVMRDVSSSTKLASAVALGRLGAVAKDAVPELRRMLDHNEYEVRVAAADALGNIGPASLPAVAKLKELRSDPSVRAAAQRALDKIEAK